MTGVELGSKVWIVGVVTLVGRLRTAAATAVATWFASAYLSVLGSKVRTTRLTPWELKELMSVIPLIEDITFSTTWVTWRSMTLGVAPGYEVRTTTAGMTMFGSRSTPSPRVETIPKITTATKMPIASTYRLMEKLTRGLIL